MPRPHHLVGWAPRHQFTEQLLRGSGESAARFRLSDDMTASRYRLAIGGGKSWIWAVDHRRVFRGAGRPSQSRSRGRPRTSRVGVRLRPLGQLLVPLAVAAAEISPSGLI